MTITIDNMEVRVIECPKEARAFVRELKALPAHVPVALDFETTGLFPDYSNLHAGAQVRLSQFCFESGNVTILDHWKCGSFYSLVDDIIEARDMYYVFYAGFEGRWFDAFCDPDQGGVTLYDVANMRKSVLGGGGLSLKLMAKWDLETDLDKDLQTSDWTKEELDDEQYLYGGFDAWVTFELACKWIDEMNVEHWNGFQVINSAWRATNEMEDTGLYLDIPYHRKLVTMWDKRLTAAERGLRRLVDKETLVNLRSKKQISDLLTANLDKQSLAVWPKTGKKGELQLTRSVLRTMSYNSPYPLSRFLAGLMVFNRADKYLGTYGQKLITIQELSGAIQGRFNIAQAVTGRYSSSSPNLQNIPRSPLVRRSFIAKPNTKLVMADYSGIEIRVLAELSHDAQLLQDCIYGDVHAESAITIYGLDRDNFMKLLKEKDPRAKALRSNAKGFTFQLLYGAGPAALAVTLRCTISEASEYVERWASRYPRAYHYRQHIFEQMNHTGFIPVISGRTIYVRKQDRTMPVASNYPVQGAAGDCMYRAIYHTHRLIVDRQLDTLMAATVHDELLLISDWSDEATAAAKECLEQGMVAGYLDIFPGANTDNLIEAVIGDSWADKP